MTSDATDYDNARSRQFTASEVDQLLGEIANDYFDRLAEGEEPCVEAYVNQHPEIGDLIRQTFAAVSLIEHSHAGNTETGHRHAGQSDAGPNGHKNPLTIGDFRIIQEIGRGGMGVVYEAEQLSMGDRRVALKVLPFAAMADPRQRQRFQNEVRAVASLDHPNIVSVYSVGEDRGVHFYAMRLIRGQSMGQLIHELAKSRQLAPLSAESVKHALSSSSIPSSPSGSTDPTEALAAEGDGVPRGATVAGPCDTDAQPQALISTRKGAKRSDYYEAVADLAIQAAEALEHAHQRGVIHRDIKPANLMIDAFSQLYVTDFGLAHIVEGVGMTMTGDLVGTLRYMSPEQALGKRVVVDYRTDIYSLGVSLYELLTTQPVFDGDNRAALLKQISFEEPEQLTQVDRSVPRDLATIVHKAMEKNPDDRYASAQELADDLRSFRAFQPITAKAPGAVDRLRKFTRRNQSIVATVVLVLLLSTIGLVISNSMIAAQRAAAESARDGERDQRIEAERQRQDAVAKTRDAERLRGVAEEQQDVLRRGLYIADMRLAGLDLTRGESSRLQKSLAKGIPNESQPDLRGWEWHYLLAGGNHQAFSLYGHFAPIANCAWSPNSRWLATVGFNQGTVVIWDAERRDVFRVLREGETRKHGVAWSPDSRLLASGDAGGNNDIRIWSIDSGEVILLSGHEDWITSLDFSPNGQYLASTSQDGFCRVWDVQRQSSVHVLPCEVPAYAVEWHASGEQVCIGGGVAEMDSVMMLTAWHPFSDETQQKSTPGPGPISCLSYTKDQDFILAGSSNGKCMKFNATTLELVCETQAHRGCCNGVTIINDQQVATGGEDQAVRVWTLDDLVPIRTLLGHKGQATDVSWNSSRGQLASAGTDGAVKIWDLKQLESFRTIYPPNAEGGQDFLWQAGQVPNIELLKSSGKVVYRRANSMPMVVPFEPDLKPHAFESSSIFELRSLCKGTDVFDIHEVLRLAAEELQNGSAVLPPKVDELLRVTEYPHGLFWSPDRSMVANNLWLSETNEHLIQVWSVRESRLVHQWGPYYGAIEVLWSPDGNWLAVDGLSCWLFNMNTGELSQKVESSGCSAAWHPHESKLLVGGRGGDLHCLEVATGERSSAVNLNVQELIDVAFSPDGTRVAVSGSDHTVRILDAQSLQELLLLDQPQSSIARLRWCFEGRGLVGLDFEGRIVLWDARPGYEAAKKRDLIVSGLYFDAVQSFFAHNYDESQRCYEAILELNPTHTDAYHWLGRSHQRGQDYPRAIAAFSKLLLVDRNWHAPWASRAECHASLSSWEAALADYEEAIRRHSPYQCQCSYSCALLNVKLHHESVYRKQCKSMLDHYGNSTEANEWNLTAWTCALVPNALDDYEPSIALAKRAVEAEPTNPEYRKSLGALFVRAGEFERARIELKQALEAESPKKKWSGYIEYLLAMTEFHLGNIDSAKEHLKVANAQAERELSSGPSWNRKLTLELLRDEATGLIGVD